MIIHHLSLHYTYIAVDMPLQLSASNVTATERGDQYEDMEVGV